MKEDRRSASAKKERQRGRVDAALGVFWRALDHLGCRRWVHRPSVPANRRRRGSRSTPWSGQTGLTLLRAVCHNLRPIFVTLGINCFLQPITMFGPSRLAVFHGTLTDTQRKDCLAGCVILGCSPFTAMVFAWPLFGLASVTRGGKNLEKTNKN